MIHLFKTCMITAFILGLTWSAPLRAYGQAVAVITAYRNVFIQDDPGMHFRRVIRNAEGQRRWRCRNSEPDAGKVLNTRLASDGLLRQ